MAIYQATPSPHYLLPFQLPLPSVESTPPTPTFYPTCLSAISDMGTCTSKQNSIVGGTTNEKALVRTPTLEGTTPLVKERVIPLFPPAYVPITWASNSKVSTSKSIPKRRRGSAYTSQVGGGYYGDGGVGYYLGGDGGCYSGGDGGGGCSSSGGGGGGGDGGGGGGGGGGD